MVEEVGKRATEEVGVMGKEVAKELLMRAAGARELWMRVMVL